jgi:hypothetical protein
VVNQLICVAMVAMVCALFCLPVGAQDGKPAQPLSMAGFADEGAFSIYVNEDRLATMSSKWTADGAFESTSTLTLAGQAVTTIVRVRPDAEGRWARIDMSTPRGPVVLVREAGAVQVSFDGKITSVQLADGSVLFANFSPALLSQAVRAYDIKKGGKQTIPVLVLPGSPLELVVEPREPIDRVVAGKDLRLNRYSMSIAGVELIASFTADGKFVHADVPQQHASYVRDGYEVLRVAETVDPLLSAPTHEVRVEPNVKVPMRDGVALATDLYIPSGDGPFPAILIRTPYKKDFLSLQANYYTRRGYAVVVQDVRGRFGSPGVWQPFVNERKDGYDSIEWAASQKWCNGKVGMIGGSYLGLVQWLAAIEQPPHLVTIVPNVPPPDPFFNIPYEYGCFFLLGSIWWADMVESEATADLSGERSGKISEKRYKQLLSSLPVIDLDEKVLGKRSKFWREWIEHPTNDAYWQAASYLDSVKNVRIPVFHQSGWFDGDGIGTKLAYGRAAAAGLRHQKLVLGPWGHTDQAHRRVGDKDFGPEAIVDLQRQYLRWFDHWLKGVDNGIAAEPLVDVFVMESNKWLRGPTYPLPQTRFEKWYLSSDGAANTAKGDGRLGTSTPTGAASDGYSYDPGDPTPDPDYYEAPQHKAGDVVSAAALRKEAMAYHESVTATRADILVYTSEAMVEPLTFAGPVSAVIYASTSGRDTDWFVRLVQIDEAGKLFTLAEGKIRARFRESMAKPVLVKPGKVLPYSIDLWHTGITIPKGHRLRVEIASAAFPVFSRNLNTGGHNEKDTRHITARQTIYHSARYPSHVVLPVIP